MNYINETYKPTLVDDEKCSQILQDIKKRKRSMTNDEWDYFKKCQYAVKKFFISSEYFEKLKNKNAT